MIFLPQMIDMFNVIVQTNQASAYPSYVDIMSIDQINSYVENCKALLPSTPTSIDYAVEITE